MRITRKTHPMYFDWMSDELSRIDKLWGVHVDDEKYAKHRLEADDVCPDMTHAEKDAWSAHVARTHPGFHGRASAEAGQTAGRRVDHWHTGLHVVAILLLIALMLLLFARSGHGQEKPQITPVLARASAEAPTPVTEKFHAKIRDIQVDQAKWRERLLNLKLEQAEVERKISEYDDAIKKIAYEAALEQKVDVTQYDLDIGTMKWVKRSKKP